MIDRQLALALLCLPLVACGPGKNDDSNNASSPQNASAASAVSNKTNSRPQTVSISRTRTESVPIILQAQGYVTAQDEVDIRPAKAGLVSAVHVKEGDEVRKGQLLFSLDSRDDEANTKKAEAALLSARTQLAIDQRTLDRNKELAGKGFISNNALDQLQTKVETDVAAAAQAEAALASVKVQLSYDRVTAPFNGRVGTINVRPGSMMTTNATTAMVKLTRVNPITVNFTLPESQLPVLRNAMSGSSAKVEIDTQSGKTAQGKVIFIENNIDRSSGTITVKAEIDNSQHQLWPGQFTSIRVLAGETKDAVTLPAQAIQSNSNGRFVYIVQDNLTVKPQPVELVQVYQSRAIVTGITSGVKVVQEGGQNLRPGGKVIEASATADAGRRSKNGQRGSGPASAASSAEHSKAADTGKAVHSTTAQSGVALPPGFTPRDPDAFAQMNDAEKQQIIARWKERQAAKGTK